MKKSIKNYEERFNMIHSVENKYVLKQFVVTKKL